MSLRLDVELWWRRHGGVMAGVALVAAICILAVMTRVETAAKTPDLVPVADVMPRLDVNLRAFRARLLSRQHLEERQQALLDHARRHHLIPGRIDYGFEWRDSGHYGIASLQLPLQGSYTDFRNFMSAALAAEPALGLEELVVRRSTTGHGIEASLRFVFFTADRQGTPS